ncbi:hypothetical protein [Gilliamella mensalis]|uniref:hypothetical protein n=1 Tax=Gilliamella mensalis TaxID=1908520 RepID=UPI000A165D65|nr:hypothetical protein [Gilliamella mensalis]
MIKQKNSKKAYKLSPNIVQKNFPLLCFYIIFPLSFPTTATLSAITAKEIKGNAPIFIQNSTENNLGFKIRDTVYNAESNNLPKSFDKNLTLNDFIVETATIDNLHFSPDNYSDKDGDPRKISDNGTFSIGETSFKWLDNAGQEITKSQYGKAIGCGSGFHMPLTLEITLSDVQVHSEYGVPKDSKLYTLAKTYEINTDSEICFAKPNQMIVNNNQTWGSPYRFEKNGKTDCLLVGYTDIESSLIDTNRGYKGWNTSGTEDRDRICGGGYDRNVFDPINGFYASANPKFPTTGFSGAQFQLIMTGAQTDWDYSVNATPAGSVTVDDNGMVYLNNKPNGTVTVSAKFKPDNSIIHSYTFNPTKTWVVPKDGAYTYEQATQVCRGEANIPTRAEMSNSPNALASWTKMPLTWDLFTRTINQGVLSEWGMTTFPNYPKSNWFKGEQWFFSSDKFPLTHQYPGRSNRYAIDAWIGQIQVWGKDHKLHAVCKE